MSISFRDAREAATVVSLLLGENRRLAEELAEAKVRSNQPQPGNVDRRFVDAGTDFCARGSEEHGAGR